MWFAVDTLMRELSGDRSSLDDFARAFFGQHDGSIATLTYDFDEVVRTLDDIVEHDWAAFLKDQLDSRVPGGPLEGLERGGYRLKYRDFRTDFCKRYDANANQFDLRFSIGFNIGSDGTIQEVMWGSAAFDAGLTSGALVQQVNGADYSHAAITEAIDAAKGGTPINLTVRARSQSAPRNVDVLYDKGHRFPYLDPIPGARRRLDEIFAPK